MEDYKPVQYWEEVLKEDFSLGGVGVIGLGVQYNKWIYRVRIRALLKLLQDYALEVAGKSLLDIGVGTGFYIDFWEQRGIGSITGLDITEPSSKTLQNAPQNFSFVRADIGSPGLELGRKFDIITAFDVLYHVVDEDSFERAIGNIRKHCHRSSYVLISDIFPDGTIKQTAHVNFRTKTRYMEVLSDNGFEVMGLVPIFYILYEPLTNQRLLKLLWKVSSAVVARSTKNPITEKVVANTIGGLAYCLDRVILKFSRDNASERLLLAKVKTG